MYAKVPRMSSISPSAFRRIAHAEAALSYRDNSNEGDGSWQPALIERI